MTLAIVLILCAAVALAAMVGLSISKTIRQSKTVDGSRLEAIDLEAFRNLVDPAETQYLRRQLPAVEFRKVQRTRLHAANAYLLAASRNAALLAEIGQRALGSEDAQTADAARRLVDSALLLRRNVFLAQAKIYVTLAWPMAGPGTSGFLQGYEQLGGAAMLLGRLQQPAVPVRISVQ